MHAQPRCVVQNGFVRKYTSIELKYENSLKNSLKYENSQKTPPPPTPPPNFRHELTSFWKIFVDNIVWVDTIVCRFQSVTNPIAHIFTSKIAVYSYREPVLRFFRPRVQF